MTRKNTLHRIGIILLHTVICIALYLLLAFSMFLGLQVNTTYGNIGMVTFMGLAGLYVWTLSRKKH